MTASYADRLENLLKRKIELLELIYESDARIRETSKAGNTSYDLYDDYLAESENYLENLDHADEESDEIINYLKSHSDEIKRISTLQSQKIRSLLLEIEGKTEAVRQIEDQIKEQVAVFIRDRRNEIRVARMQSKVVGGHYAPQGIMSREEMTTFDTKN